MLSRVRRRPNPATGGKDGVALVGHAVSRGRKPGIRRGIVGGPGQSRRANRVGGDSSNGRPDAVRFMRVCEAGRLRQNRLGKSGAELSATQVAERERATSELEAMMDAAKPGLEQAMKGPLAAEGRKRVQAMLDELRRPTLTGERLRQWRAVAVLEKIGTPDAAALLKELAGGWGEARLTHDAADARARLTERRKA